MSVVVVVSRDADPAPFVGWGRRFAAARGLQLEILTNLATESKVDHLPEPWSMLGKFPCKDFRVPQIVVVIFEHHIIPEHGQSKWLS